MPYFCKRNTVLIWGLQGMKFNDMYGCFRAWYLLLLKISSLIVIWVVIFHCTLICSMKELHPTTNSFSEYYFIIASKPEMYMWVVHFAKFITGNFIISPYDFSNGNKSLQYMKINILSRSWFPVNNFFLCCITSFLCTLQTNLFFYVIKMLCWNKLDR